MTSVSTKISHYAHLIKNILIYSSDLDFVQNIPQISNQQSHSYVSYSKYDAYWVIFYS